MSDGKRQELVGQDIVGLYDKLRPETKSFVTTYMRGACLAKPERTSAGIGSAMMLEVFFLGENPWVTGGFQQVTDRMASTLGDKARCGALGGHAAGAASFTLRGRPPAIAGSQAVPVVRTAWSWRSRLPATATLAWVGVSFVVGAAGQVRVPGGKHGVVAQRGVDGSPGCQAELGAAAAADAGLALVGA